MDVKYEVGDLVKVTKTVNEHAIKPRTQIGIILEVSTDETVPFYALYIYRRGFSAWHHEDILSLLKKDCNHILQKWKNKDQNKTSMRDTLPKIEMLLA